MTSENIVADCNSYELKSANNKACEDALKFAEMQLISSSNEKYDDTSLPTQTSHKTSAELQDDMEDDLEDDRAEISSSRDYDLSRESGIISSPQFPIQSPTFKGRTMLGGHISSTSPPTFNDRLPMLQFRKLSNKGGKLHGQRLADEQCVAWPGLSSSEQDEEDEQS